MEKFCIFWGERPESKSKEHVLPQWLIKMTGDPKRIAAFGVDFAKQPFEQRQFSFDALTFPACSQCNSDFGHLETAAEPVVGALVSDQPVSAGNLILLLDWLDKVRVGLWLGYFYLNKNPLGITPSFHIQHRVGQLDRMVAIIKMAESSVGLNFAGPHSDFYQLSPTCFGLRINGLWLVNASGISLCSRRLGFPFAEPLRIRDDHKLEVSFHRGSERILHPIERFHSLPDVVSLYQPVYRACLESGSAKEYWKTDWVSAHSADLQRGLGKLFLQKDGSVRPYPDAPSLDWVPSRQWKAWEIVHRVPKHIYERLSESFEFAISISSNKDQRKHMRGQAAMIKAVDRMVLRSATEESIRLKHNS
jgi:hypothetical protein